ncbi:MAG: ABC transporter ATP-binding protein [Deltaproteobacteria bacterium]|nr:ABC transporter ATP-binding protein [Deltaproteobacteria bacterium]
MLTLEGVCAGYGRVPVLRDVSLKVEKGTVVALLGANGAGKSTVMKTIAGLLKPTAGVITLDGKAISGLPPPEIVRRSLSLVPEGREIFTQLSVHENLRMGAYSRSDGGAVEADEERVFALFPILKQRKLQKGGTLSGGEQQMLAIGRALMSRPSVLLLDEPSMGLAPLLVREIFAIIREIHAQGTTVVVVEQNAQMALAVADHAYVFETGRIVREAPAAELLSDESVKRAYLGG